MTYKAFKQYHQDTIEMEKEESFRQWWNHPEAALAGDDEWNNYGNDMGKPAPAAPAPAAPEVAPDHHDFF
jgi:hypothetical protein